jgi:hypothetical protein
VNSRYSGSACAVAAEPRIAVAAAPTANASVMVLTRWRREVVFICQGCACGLGASLVVVIVQCAQSIPNMSAKVARPSSVTVTARPRVTRLAQPADRKRSSSARPSAPDKW